MAERSALSSVFASSMVIVIGPTPVITSYSIHYTKLYDLQNKRFWLESEKRFVRLRVSHKGVRIIDKHGIDKVVADLRAQGQHV